MPAIAEVTFEPKSPWQKDDCITGCGAPSTLEAVYSGRIEGHDSTTVSRVRCCEKDECKQLAAEWALVPFKT